MSNKSLIKKCKTSALKRKGILFLLSCVFCFICTNVIAEELEKTFKNFYPEADVEGLQRHLQIYEQKCAQNDAKACLEVGHLYSDTANLIYRIRDAIPKDIPKAITYFERACLLDNSWGCFFAAYNYYPVAQVFMNYKYVPTFPQTKRLNYDKAAELYKKGCQMQCSYACTALSYLSLTSDSLFSGIRHSISNSLEYATQACRYGDARACYNLGSAYYSEDSYSRNVRQSDWKVLPNVSKALKFFKAGCLFEDYGSCEAYRKARIFKTKGDCLKNGTCDFDLEREYSQAQIDYIKDVLGLHRDDDKY